MVKKETLVMKIKKGIYGRWFFYYYVDSKTCIQIRHGLYNACNIGVGYHYHTVRKGFWLVNKKNKIIFYQ